MKKLIIGLSLLVSMSAFADGFSRQTFKISLSGYSEAPSIVSLGTTEATKEQIKCSHFNDKYSCTVILENKFLFLPRKLPLNIIGGFKTTVIQASVSAICNNGTEFVVTDNFIVQHKKDGKTYNVLLEYLDATDAFNFCNP